LDDVQSVAIASFKFDYERALSLVPPQGNVLFGSEGQRSNTAGRNIGSQVRL
jgi:hypothetical protein